MRFRSKAFAAGRVYAVSGTNTVSFALVVSDAIAGGLLGFAVERFDDAKGEHYFMAGFKVFESVIPNPSPHLQVSTFEHPVQSFVWDDFTCAPGHEYRYVFHPLKGTAKNLDRSTSPLSITIRTEPLAGAKHDILFNRGVASSQAYERRFGRDRIEDLDPAEREAALKWLSRDLGTALLRFIKNCDAGDALHCCFYEFRYRPVAEALKAAIDRGVDVQLIVDARDNSSTDRNGVFHEAFPREENLRLIADIGLPATSVIRREHRSTAIAHNKFMVRSRHGAPSEVWTGSTNLSQGGISGQTNVGHRVRDAAVARSYLAYWKVLADDPGAIDGHSTSQRKAENAAFEADVEAISPVPANLRTVPKGTTAVFSPRVGAGLLDSYAALLDSAQRSGCITLAFGVSDVFKSFLRDNSAQNALVFMLLEKRDLPNPRSKKAFVWINSRNNVYKAWGAYLRDPVYQWARETNAGLLGLNHHVSYVHSKFLLVDPLSADPIVVTGSANFSDPSVNENDENMLIIRGDTRVADIYLTEFNRLFNHYYFRSVTEATADRASSGEDTLFLREDDSWQAKYAPGSLKRKRLDLFAGLEGAVTL